GIDPAVSSLHRDPALRHEQTSPSSTDRRRAGNPARPLAARPLHRPAGPYDPRTGSGRRLHDRPQTAPDHGGKGPRRPRRARPLARLPGAATGGANTAATAPRSPRTGLRRIDRETRDAGPLGPARLAG